MKHVITILIALVLCLSTGLAALAGTKPTPKGSGYGIIGSNQKIKMFDGIAELDLKKGWEFLDSRAYYRWSVGNGDTDIQERDSQD